MGNGGQINPPRVRRIVFISSVIGAFIGTLLALIVWTVIGGSFHKPEQAPAAINQQGP